MCSFREMLRKTTSSLYHDKMIRFAKPLNDHFGINHFWYYKITYSGYYSYLGTHRSWSEFCFDNSMVQHFSCLRHPDSLQKGINLMRTSRNEDYQKVMEIAWGKFKINFHINLVNPISDGVEACGFASCFNDSQAEERLLNHLPLLRKFTKIFKEKNEELLGIAENNQVYLPAQFGPKFYERGPSFILPLEKDQFLKCLGFGQMIALTSREKDMLKFASAGYPASYIAKQLHLSPKTVENYLSTIKAKLECNSKIELIKKARELDGAGYFDP